VRNYINLTAGLEWNLNPDGFLRLQSSHLESKAFDKFLCSVSDDVIFHIVTGTPCRILDCSSRKKIGRVIFQGVPLIMFVLKKALGINSKAIVKGINVTEYFENVYKKLSKDTKNKYKYYIKFYKGNIAELTGETKKSIFDGKENNEYKNLWDLICNHKMGVY
jgi:hypothetical protein